MPRITEGERLRRARWFMLHYWDLSRKRPEEVHQLVKEELGFTCKDRQLATYMANARGAIIAEGLFDDDKQALKAQLDKSLETFNSIADRARQDEVHIRNTGFGHRDPDHMRILKDLQATQLQAERAIHAMLKDAGVTAERKEIDILLQTDAFITWAKAHMRIVWDLLPQDSRQLYLERCRALEGSTMDSLRQLVEGAALPITAIAGGKNNGHGAQERGEAEELGHSGEAAAHSDNGIDPRQRGPAKRMGGRRHKRAERICEPERHHE